MQNAHLRRGDGPGPRAGHLQPNGIWQIGPMIIKWGTPEQQDRWLPCILNADEHWCQGFSEPEAGSDLANMRTMAIARRRRLRRERPEDWISSAHLAKWGLFLLRTDPTAFERGAKHEGITAFIIDMETPGIECRPIRDITGDTMLNEVWFTDAVIPLDCRLGDEGEGWQVAMSTLGHERVGTAGLSITMASDLKSMISAAHAVNPDALDDPELRERIGKAFTRHRAHPAPQLPGAHQDHQGPAELARGPAGQAAVVEDQPRRWPSSQSTCSAPTGVLGKGGPDAIDGGTWARNYSWQRYTSIGAGATEIQKNIIAKKAIKLPRK